MLITIHLKNYESVVCTDRPSTFLKDGEKTEFPLVILEEEKTGKTHDNRMDSESGLQDSADEQTGSDTHEAAGGSYPDAWCLQLKEEELRILSLCSDWEEDNLPDFLDASWFYRLCDRFYRRPWKIAESDRLLIRELTVEDAETLQILYDDDEIRRFTEELPEEPDEIRELLAGYIHFMYELTGVGIWGVFENESGNLIGRVGFEPAEDGEGLDLGYLLAADKRGQGIAREMCEMVLDYAKEELEIDRREIHCRIAEENKASLKLAGKLGVQIEVLGKETFGAFCVQGE